ncbi:hypothetical protein [Photobacterium leiognathi]|uniref:hypothetical protein n=1 Tax=Photobacterium leiognathi TaxID=553611 RepID=UPI002980F85D|nr:hypothetical protein [Photobacterium leiognathi]
MNNAEQKHLEFVQNVVTRMNSNSFQIKNWSITVFTALFALYGSNANSFFLFIATLPTLLFWMLDAYYLQQERKFRGIYEDVAKLSDNPKSTKLFQMNPSLYVKGKYSYTSSLLSITELKLYLPLIFLSQISHYLTTGTLWPEKLSSLINTLSQLI